jgi:glycine/D-amino acid oxidase-like deaminating enzyme
MGSVAPRRIVIVGCGFLGAAIAFEAVRRGFETRVLSGSAPKFADGWTAMVGDAADAGTVLRHLQ